MIEIWKPCVDYPSYEVSNCGQVKRVIGGPGVKIGRILRGHRSKRRGQERYVYHDLSEDGIVYRVSLHDLVAAAFIGPKPSGMTVNHKDLDRFNNSASNLEYATDADNIKHAVEAARACGKRIGRPPKATDLGEKVRALFGLMSQRQIAKKFGVSPQLVTLIKQGKTSY
jgi:hypothetical protein